jgi:hypothetical protein
MTIMINPGSGPVEGTTEEQAKANMEAFAKDLRDAGLYATGLTRNEPADDRGRFGYFLQMGDARRLEVEMPGTPLEQVRYTGEDDQDIWDFPCLYIDGSSWIWKFALSACEPPEGYVAPDRSGPAPYELDPADADDDADETAGECTNPECGCKP